MLRIFADFNNMDGRGRVRLNCIGSLEDIERLGDQIKIGATVILDEPYEFEVRAVLDYDEQQGTWVGHPDWDTVTHHDAPGQG